MSKPTDTTPDTSIGERIDEIFETLRYTVLNRQVKEGEWQSEVWFKITDKPKKQLKDLLADTLRSVKLPEKKPAEPLDDTEDEQFYEELGFNQGISEAQEALNKKIKEVENG